MTIGTLSLLGLFLINFDQIIQSINEVPLEQWLFNAGFGSLVLVFFIQLLKIDSRH